MFGKGNFRFYFLFLITFVLGVCSCSSKSDGTVTIIDVGDIKMAVLNLNELKTDVATVPLSSLLDYCVLVQLDSNVDDAYVFPQDITVTDKYIGINSQRREPYKLFDRSGKFLCNVGSFGRGPGESPSAFWDNIIDDENDLIYFVSGGWADRTYIYNTTGHFLKEIVFPHRLIFPSITLHNNILIVMHIPLENQAKIYQFDVNTGDLLDELPPPAGLSLERVSADHVIFSTRNVPDFFDLLSITDTLYHYDLKNNRINPFFAMPFITSQDIWKQHMIINKDLIITDVKSIGERGIFESTDLFVAIDLKHKTSSYVKFENDFFGKLPVPINFFNLRNGYWTQSMMPEELIEDIENRLAERVISEKDREVLEKTLSTLKEGANNLVFIGKLKSEVRRKLW